MRNTSRILLLSASLTAALALGACSKQDDTSSAPAAASTAATTAPAAAPAATTPPSASSTTPAPASTPASAPASVESVDLGKAIDSATDKISAPTTSFSSKDTIYAAVSVVGTGDAKVDVKWSYQDGQTVKQDSSTVTAPKAVEFHIEKPSGWPKGNYKVDVAIDGKPATSKDFTVQ